MNDKLAAIIDDFSFLDDWEDRYRYVIELGRDLEPLAETEMTDVHRVKGCASQVWLITERAQGEDPLLHFRGDSDAHIVKGLVAIMLALYSDRKASEIAGTNAEDTFKLLGLDEHLTPQRANGLRAMARRIRQEAELALAPQPAS
ncbi:SufE family protein [Mesorhizobium xinjiangense]|uniref:SufE family protein n=1 Tax=Mesorhizobium xinjiangense TaxID=2678685 RepID=UPI0012EE5EB7|nr:SufE family protein [Mesorhizobium xinjiangense]